MSVEKVRSVIVLFSSSGSCVKDNLSCGRICIRTKEKSNILERVSVSIDDSIHKVRVKEFVVWAPSIKRLEDENVSVARTDSSEKVHSRDNDEGNNASYANDLPLNSALTPTSSFIASTNRKYGSPIKGTSMINKLARYIEIGKVMGYDLENCSNDLSKLINGMSEKFVDK
ncbi:hypothetical protein L1987_24421 [Smallanthus sonchifolius]|uniref:Uncharacterized protein n=1 Tax=Smallanthus sonchifolius TaxID=185202 RepID=A0ACB9IKF4_9ASTR|nr:hypothetical protein L1987_24421 [Smallanthus sonchifolius]